MGIGVVLKKCFFLCEMFKQKFQMFETIKGFLGGNFGKKNKILKNENVGISEVFEHVQNFQFWFFCKF